MVHRSGRDGGKEQERPQAADEEEADLRCGGRRARRVFVDAEVERRPGPPPADYSSRSNTSGSSRAAAQAGIQHAAMVVSPRTASTIDQVVGSPGVTPYSTDDSARASHAASTAPSISPDTATA